VKRASSSGAIQPLVENPGELIQGYKDLWSQAALVSASSVDFLILTASAASFIPDDLKRRRYDGKISPQAIALSTFLLPGLGAALYCALRPSLEEE